MPTTDERREVAARLREARVFDPECCIAVAVGLRCVDFGECWQCHEQIFNRLADLIEPESERTCSPVEPFDSKTKHIVERGSNHYYWPYKGCPECQCDFPQGSNYCPNCGAKVVE